MKNIAIYPGTFDPITFGHIDVIRKALKFVDKVIVGISDGNQKNFLFSIDERVKIVKKAKMLNLSTLQKKNLFYQLQKMVMEKELHIMILELQIEEERE